MGNSRFYFLILLASLFFTGSLALAEDEAAETAVPAAEVTEAVAEPPKAEAVKAEDTDISELAEEYWRPRVDELEVIQNRRFEKSGRMELTALYGFYQGGEYVDSKATGLALTYNLSNAWAVEVSYLKIHNENSDFLDAVRARYGFTPDYNEEKCQYTASLHWTPIYAKFSVLGRGISHFETYLGPGVGFTDTGTNRLTGNLHVGEKFFITENIILRVEWKMSWYTDLVRTTQGSTSTANGGPGFVEDRKTKHNILFGLGWMF